MMIHPIKWRNASSEMLSHPENWWHMWATAPTELTTVGFKTTPFVIVFPVKNMSTVIFSLQLNSVKSRYCHQSHCLHPLKSRGGTLSLLCSVQIYSWCLTSYPHQQMRPSASRFEITVLSVKMPLPSPLHQWKRYKTLHSTQTGRDDLLFTSMISSSLFLFLFLLSMFGSKKRFFFRSF